jgi:hypothetical protein
MLRKDQYFLHDYFTFWWIESCMNVAHSAFCFDYNKLQMSDIGVVRTEILDKYK